MSGRIFSATLVACVCLPLCGGPVPAALPDEIAEARAKLAHYADVRDDHPTKIYWQRRLRTLTRACDESRELEGGVRRRFDGWKPTQLTPVGAWSTQACGRSAALGVFKVGGKDCPCSGACACGCNQGSPCTCGNVPARRTPVADPTAKPKASSAGKKASRSVSCPRCKDLPPDEECPCRKTGRPCGPDCGCVLSGDLGKFKAWELSGVNTERLSKTRDTPRIRLYSKGNVREISPEDAVRRFKAGLPDDKDKLRLTLIGAEADCDRVLADLKASPELAEFRSRYVVQSYRPENWAVRNYGFVTTGKPTIYLQVPANGYVPLMRVDAYAGPAKLASQLRNADPSYEPAKDPDGTPSPSLPGGDMLAGLFARVKALPWYVWALAAAGVILFIVNRKGESK